MTGLNSFISNVANVSGGGFYWNDIQPVYQDNQTSNMIFNNNSASVYANDIGSYSMKLVAINQSQYDQ